MRIVFYIDGPWDEYGAAGRELAEAILSLQGNQSRHELIILSTAAGANENLVRVPPIRTPFQYLSFARLRLPALLKKYRAQLFVSVIPFPVKGIPAVHIFNDAGLLSFAACKGLGKKMANAWVTKALLQSKRISTTKQVADEIETHFRLSTDAATLLNFPLPATGNARPAAVAIDDPYFLYEGALTQGANAITVLKAFSLFKKRMKSEWKLVLATRSAVRDDHFFKSLGSYRFRQDVILRENISVSESRQLQAGAFLYIQGTGPAIFDPGILHSLTLHVPAIVDFRAPLPAAWEKAVVRTDLQDPRVLGEQLMLLYRSENIRREMVNNMPAEPGSSITDWLETIISLYLSAQ